MTSASWEGKGKYDLNKEMMVGNTLIRPHVFFVGGWRWGMPLPSQGEVSGRITWEDYG